MTAEPFAPVEVIAAKRDGGALSDAQIDWVVDAYVRGAVTEEQMAALAMAVVLRGMDDRETSRWTDAMVRSGRRLAWPDAGRPTTDKHSTGGVGDGTTLVLAPLVAACGAAVPQLSGRGLGHTGGTLDKLEAVPGWRADLTVAEMTAQLRDVGAFVAAAGADVVPADQRLYALRDATATVESRPLIASSIMSKKIAEGTGALVLDVTVGSGAFLPGRTDARRLAETMVALGDRAGVPTVALLTAMESPLGRAVGNALEVAQAVEVLAGGGPADFVGLVLELAREMLRLAGLEPAGPADPQRALRDGRAMDVWRRMLRAQGGDPDEALPVARVTAPVRAAAGGTLVAVDARAVGVAAWRLGAGRARRGDRVDPAAGVRLLAGVGDRVRGGDPVLELHTDDEERLGAATDALAGALVVQPGDVPLPVVPLVLERVEGELRPPGRRPVRP